MVELKLKFESTQQRDQFVKWFRGQEQAFNASTETGTNVVDYNLDFDSILFTSQIAEVAPEVAPEELPVVDTVVEEASKTIDKRKK